MLMIFLFSAQSGEQSGRLSNGFLESVVGEALEVLLPRLSDQGAAHDIRKYAHMFEYLCLGLSAALFAFERRRFARARLRSAALSALLFCFLYACSDELHQCFVPSRSGQFTDVLVDAVGFSVGIITISCVNLANRLDKRRKKG